MRYLVECQWQNEIFEIDTDRDETSPLALRRELAKVDPETAHYSRVLTSLTGRNRTIIVAKSKLEQVRIEVYLRRSGLIG